jgi:hypothetical protein
MVASVGPVVLIACAVLGAPSPHLAEGIRLYKAQNYAEALAAFTLAIDEPNTRPSKARIHVYIGLIQYRFNVRQDARASFEKAIDYEPDVKLPKANVQPGARKLFAKVKREKLGDAEPRKKPKGPPGEEPKPAVEAPPPPDPPAPPPAPPPPIAAPPPAVAPPPPPPPPPAIEVAPPPPPLVTTTTEVAPDEPSIVPWIVIGAGAAAIVAGAVVGGVALSNVIGADGEPFAADAKSRYDAGVRQGIGAIVTLSIGVVATGAGGALFAFE